MNDLLKIINKDQQKASNPLSSVWVAASAGSGKTKVLTDRVLNLLLLNGQPEKLLCLTFTKTAAAEMSNRINDVLKSWVVMSDEKLAEEIEKLSGDYADSELLDKARRLFALSLEAPGGMKIMTIHSFCQSVLKRFPLEADVSPNFEVMDDTTSNEMLNRLLHEAFKNPALQKDVAYLSGELDETSFMKIFKEILGHRSALMQLKERIPSLETLIYQLKLNYNINNYLSENEIINEHFDLDEWAQKKKLYLYAEGGKKHGVKDKYIDNEEAHLAFEIDEKLKSFKVITATASLLAVAYFVLGKYFFEKQTKSMLDYDDLIEKTKELLEQSDKAAWVLYKLDGGIDHILVDEAQDTNPDQWAIIRMLAEEFFSGNGASDAFRTIFAVGDKKQSIYSFQGADPSEFERMRVFFNDKVTASQNDFITVPLNYSFRSTKPVLDLVNMVLRNNTAKNGVLEPMEKAIHLSFRDKDAGLVEIWPLEQAYKTDEPDPWKPPVERQTVQSAETRLAQKIALKIKNMIESKEILPSQGRPIKPGDFLILVQRRRKFVGELVRFLKEYNVPVAGIDRLVITNHIAVQDLLAMAKFALLQNDDLNLACVLKSPLIGLTEEQLFDVCYNRGAKTVWERVNNLFPNKAALLGQIMDNADKMPPFEFFSYILSVLGGRKYFVARLGDEANEALDEFLNLCMTFEQNNTSSLQGFLTWISEKSIEIKRDLDNSSVNAVRIMTVHGSKGLQGNIVFLPDTRFVPRTPARFVWDKKGNPLWIPNKNARTEKNDEIFDELDTLRMQEYRRLLYVAITRPKDRLYICGWEGKKQAVAGNWYDLILGAIEYTPDEDGIIRFKSAQRKEVNPEQIQTQKETPIELPPWVYTSPLPEPVPPKPLSPSKPVDETVIDESALTAAQELAMRRGTYIHKLLQFLPQIAPENRKATAEKIKPQDIDLPDNFFDVFENHNFKELFGPNSLAEVPVVGVVDGRAISGQIDRLVEKENEVLIVDFKSNRYVPSSPDKIPQVYKTQMSTYKALLKNVFPAKMIKTYLLWIENMSLMEIE